MLPFTLKELVNKPENKELLIHYEASIPSWSSMMARYGYYKPCMRHVLRCIIIVMTIITFLIGLYDLYKNVPVVRDFLVE